MTTTVAKPKCQSCERPATFVTSWRTGIMDAPAFWYDCAEHIAVTKASLNRNPTVIARTLDLVTGYEV
jgi:hypothetical protein